jgi:DNA polymerase-1
MKKFLLVDGNSMLFRAYYATAYGRPMTTSKGVPTNAVYGFITMFQKAIEIVKPEAVLVAFDAGKHTFRHELYADYKGGRKPAPDDLVPQFSLIRDFCDAAAVKWVEMPDIEADDLIGTASKKAPDYETYILTSDHDMLQLADDSTTVLLMKKGITEMDAMTPDKIRSDYSIEPLQIIDLKGLMGDASDNYPGIPGVGEKTAVKLLKQYGSVEEVLAHDTEIKGALGKKVQANHDNALLSKKLASIKRDVPLDFSTEDCTYTCDYAGMIKYLHSLDMNALAMKYEDLSVCEEASALADQKTASTVSFQRVSKIPASFCLDETVIFLDEDQGSFSHASIHGFGVCSKDGTVYISFEDMKKDSEFLAYLQQEEPHKIGYDIKRNMHLLQHAGMKICFHDDAMILASLADSTLTSTGKIMEHYSLSTDVSFEDVYGKANKPVLFIDEEKQCAYACANACNVRKLYDMTIAKIAEYHMTDLYRNIEMPLSGILYEMEREGITCDIKVLDRIASETSEKIDALQSQIYKEAGREFNINSTKQLGDVLYDDLALPSGKKRSTAADKLEKLVGIHPIIEEILEYRKLSKIYSTYAEGLKKYIEKDGRIHTIYNQCATQTGRLSSSEPNLQNISVRDEQGREIRKAFLADPGCVLISSDYHQIELRMLAHMAEEPGLIDAFNSGIDVHTKTAMDVFGVKMEDVTPLMRRRAKVVNFGIVYGISDFGLAQQLGTSRAEAKQFIDTYYEKYPGIRRYMDGIVAECQKNGYVTTICGRRRDIPEIHDKNHMVQEFGKRAAMNAPIQGSAADLIKIAMIHIHEAMKKAGVRSKMILQVHDELIFNVPEDEIEIMKKLIDDGMSHAMSLRVPLTAECSIGHDWYEAK